MENLNTIVSSNRRIGQVFGVLSAVLTLITIGIAIAICS